MFVVEDDILNFAEGFGVPGSGDFEPVDGYIVNDFLSFGVMVFPCNIIEGSGCKDFDIEIGCDFFSDKSCVVFGAAVYIGAVALNDDTYVFFVNELL